jgi:hypothetical protein
MRLHTRERRGKHHCLAILAAAPLSVSGRGGQAQRPALTILCEGGEDSPSPFRAQPPPQYPKTEVQEQLLQLLQLLRCTLVCSILILSKVIKTNKFDGAWCMTLYRSLPITYGRTGGIPP